MLAPLLTSRLRTGACNFASFVWNHGRSRASKLVKQTTFFFLKNCSLFLLSMGHILGRRRRKKDGLGNWEDCQMWDMGHLCLFHLQLHPNPSLHFEKGKLDWLILCKSATPLPFVSHLLSWPVACLFKSRVHHHFDTQPFTWKRLVRSRFMSSVYFWTKGMMCGCGM